MIIDLGDRAPIHDDAVERPPWNRRRAWYAGLVVISLLVLVGASGAAQVNPLPLVADLPIGTFAHLIVQDDRALVLDTRGDAAEITAYALPGGRRLWSAPVAGTSVNARLVTTGGMVVVTTEPKDNSGDVVQGFDVVTGHERWRRSLEGVTDTSAGLLTVGADMSGYVGGGYNVDDLDPATGHTRWTVPVDSDCAITFNDGADAAFRVLIEFCTFSGELSAFDLRTGVLRAHGHFAVSPTNNSQLMPLVVADGVLVVSMDNHPGLSMTAYRVSDLVVLWSGQPGATSTLLNACAPVLCLDGLDGTAKLDPHTGRPIPAPKATFTTQLRPRSGVLEFVVVPVGRDSALNPADADVNVVPALPAGTALDVLGFHAGEVVTTWIAVQSSDRTIRPLAALRHVGASCVFESMYVACATAADRLSVYRLPSL